jgi:hypothetical protein
VTHPQTGTDLVTQAHPFLLRLSKSPRMVLATLTSPVLDLSSGTAAPLQDGADPPTHIAEQAASPLAVPALGPRLLHLRQPLLRLPASPLATTLLVEERPRRPVKEASLVTAAVSMGIVEAQQTTARPPIIANLDLALALRVSC